MKKDKIKSQNQNLAKIKKQLEDYDDYYQECTQDEKCNQDKVLKQLIDSNLTINNIEKEFGEFLMKCIGPTVNSTRVVSNTLVKKNHKYFSSEIYPVVGRTFGQLQKYHKNTEYYDDTSIFRKLCKEHIDLIKDPKKRAIAKEFLAFRDKAYKMVNGEDINITLTEPVDIDFISYTQVKFYGDGQVTTIPKSYHILHNIKTHKAAALKIITDVSTAGFYTKTCLFIEPNKTEPMAFLMKISTDIKYANNYPYPKNEFNVNDNIISNISQVFQDSNVKDYIDNYIEQCKLIQKVFKWLQNKYVGLLILKGNF